MNYELIPCPVSSYGHPYIRTSPGFSYVHPIQDPPVDTLMYTLSGKHHYNVRTSTQASRPLGLEVKTVRRWFQNQGEETK